MNRLTMAMLIAILTFTSLSPSPEASPGAAQPVTAPKAYLPIVYKDNKVPVDTRCVDPLKQPAALTSQATPGALTNPSPQDCATGFVDSAPPAVTPMTTSAGDVKVILGALDDTTASYQPYELVRDHFGPLQLGEQNWDSRTKVGVTLPGGWANMTTIQWEAVTTGTLITTTPNISYYYTCLNRNPDRNVPFEPGVAYYGNIIQSGKAVGGVQTASVQVGKTETCPRDDINVPGPAPLIVAMQFDPPGLTFGSGATFSGGADGATSLRYRVMIGSSNLGELTSHILRPWDYTYRSGVSPSADATRRPYLAVPADSRGGLFYVNTGEYVAPLQLFAAAGAGAGVAASLSLQYSSLESLLYRGVAALPTASKYVKTPFGQGWSYTYGIRLLKRPIGAYSSPGVTNMELIGPGGERSWLNWGSFSQSWDGVPAWAAGSVSVVNTDTGYRMSEGDGFFQYSFDSDGRLKEIRDTRYATPLTISYTGGEQIVTDSGGRVVRFRFTGERITEVIDPLGNTWSFSYTNDSLTSITHQATGYRWKFAYDQKLFVLTSILEPDCRLTRLTYLDGTEAEAAYASAGSFKSSYTAADHSVSVTYAADRTVLVRGADQGTTTFRAPGWDGQAYPPGFYLGGPSYPTDFEMTDALGQKHKLSGYDKLTRHTDPAGNITEYLLYLNNLGGGMVLPSGGRLDFNYENTVPPTYPRNLTTVVRSPSLGSSQPITMTYQYDTSHRLVRAIAPDDNPSNPQHPTRYEYDATGRLVTMTDAEGRVTRYTYRTQAGQTDLVATRSLESSDGQTITVQFAYDAMGNVVVETDERGGIWLYSYDPMSRLVRITSPSAQGPAAVEQFAYDPRGNLVTQRDAKGRDTTYTYDGIGRLLSVTYPDGAAESYKYDNRGFMTERTNVLGGKISHTYDALGRITGVSGPNTQSTTYVYDTAGNLFQETTGSDTTEFLYDEMGQLKKVTPPAITLNGVSFQPVQTIRYDGLGPPITQKTLVRPGAEMGTRTVYDSLGRELELHSHSGPPVEGLTPSFYTSVEYDKTGLVKASNGMNASWSGTARPASIVDSGLSTPQRREMAYDGFGRPVSVTDSSDGMLARWRHDQAGNITRVELLAHSQPSTQQQGSRTPQQASSYLVARTAASYDELGQLTEISDGQSEPVRFAYDVGGNLVWTKDERDCTAVYTYDAGDRITRIVAQDPGGTGQSSKLIAADYTYDLAGNMTSSIGPYEESLSAITASGARSGPRASGAPAGAPRTVTGYDVSGRPVTVTVGTSTYRFEYRAGDGMLDRVIDASGKQIKYEYEAGRLRRVTDATGHEIESREVDGKGRQVRAQRGEFVKEWSYEHNLDVPSRITWTHQGAQGTHSYSLGIKVDDKGRVGEVTEPDGTTVRYWYYTNGRIRQVQRGGKVWYYSYDGAGTLDRLTLPNDVTAFAYYDDRGRLSRWDIDRTSVTSGDPALSRSYSYGNGIVTVDESAYTAAGASQLKTNFNWTKLGLDSEVIEATAADGSKRSLTKKMAYSSGDRTGLIVDGDRASSRSYEYLPNTNQILKVSPGAFPCPSNSEGLYVSHDPTGNVRRHSCDSGIKTGVTYDYDEGGRLTGVTSDDQSPLGIFGVTYAYDADGALARRADSASGETTYWVDLQEFGLLQELDGNFNPKNSYMVDPFGTKLGRFDSNGTARYYIYDPEGRLSVVADGSQRGQVSYQPRVDSFGEPIRMGYNDSDEDDRFAFGGLFRDSRTGLVQFTADRWYHSTTGRFLQPSEETGTASPYQFSGVSPLPGTMPDAPEDGRPSVWENAWATMKLSLMLNPITLPMYMGVSSAWDLTYGAYRRYQTLTTHGGLSGGSAAVTAGALAVGDLLGAGSAIEAWTDYNAREGGRAFTTGEKWLAYGELGLSLVLQGAGGRLMGGASRGLSTGARATTRVIPAAEARVSSAAARLRSLRAEGALLDKAAARVLPDVGPPMAPEIRGAIMYSSALRGTLVHTPEKAERRLAGQAYGRVAKAFSSSPEMDLPGNANLGTGFHEVAHDMIIRFMRKVGRDPAGLTTPQHEYLVTKLIDTVSRDDAPFFFNAKYMAHNERNLNRWRKQMSPAEHGDARAVFRQFWQHLLSDGP